MPVKTETAHDIAQAILDETFFAQKDGETPDQYIVRLIGRRDLYVAELDHMKEASTKYNSDLKEATRMLPDIFKSLEPTRKYRSTKEKEAKGQFAELKF